MRRPVLLSLLKLLAITLLSYVSQRLGFLSVFPKITSDTFLY